MVNKNKCKKHYYAKKFKKTKDGMFNSKKAELSSNFIGDDKVSPSLKKSKEAEYAFGNKIDALSNNDLGEKLDTISLDLGKYIKSNQKWLIVRVLFGISIGLSSVGLFVYGKIKLDTLIDLLKLVGSSVGLG